ncbi:MAG: hypothetical protein L3I99_03710 [Sulfurimonas sp.]|nr:hypothetical protein [Sulfurimonas sp.]
MSVLNKKYFLVVVVLLLTTAVLEARSTVGGIVFLNTYISDTDDDTKTNKITKFNVKVPNNSRLRIRWDNEDSVGMYLEAGFGSGNELKVRHAYGKWDIDERWQILIGHTSTPFAPLNPQVSMVHNSGDGFGNPNPSRQSQFRLTYKLLNRQGAVSIAILDPNSGENYDTNSTSGIELERESTMPRIDIGAVYKTFDLQIFPSAFYTKSSFENTLDSVSVWGASLGLRTASEKFTFALEGAVGENWGNTKMSDTSSVAGNSRTAAIRNGNELIDNKVTKGWVDVGYRFAGDTFKGEFHVVAGYDKTKSSDDAVQQEFENTMYGISVPIDLPWIARGFRIRPEYFVFNEKDKVNNNSDRKETIIGVQVQVTF